VGRERFARPSQPSHYGKRQSGPRVSRKVDALDLADVHFSRVLSAIEGEIDGSLR